MKRYLFLFIGVVLFSCSTINSNTENKRRNEISSSFFLSDSLFILKDIKNSFAAENVIANSASKRSLIKLDSFETTKLIFPVLSKEMEIVKMDSSFKYYVLHYMSSYFIAKQKSIGKFLPIIVWVEGDDFGALYYILLDKENIPVSFYKMNGGQCAGPNQSDSLLEMCPEIQSWIKGDEIWSYRVIEFIKPDSIKHPAIVDSVNYVSKILPSGYIETKRKDSIRFKRMSKW